jgi:uroporphyrinogen decarboxylase
MTSAKPLLDALKGHRRAQPPVWMMRQAGRHLPEYREVRSRAKDFLDFCYSPSLASEATLQPVRRYGMDGAILFADILLVLDAMGRGVRFVEGEGPLVESTTQAEDLRKVPLERQLVRLEPVAETVRRVKSSLSPETTLIGFAGAPFTVGVYAIEGKGGGDKSDARRFGYRNPTAMQGMLDALAETSVRYLQMQADAGADVLMLFESWAEGLPASVFEEWVIAPTQTIVRGLRALGVKQPIIGFPRGAGANLLAYAERAGVDAVGLDTAVPPEWAHSALPKGLCVQGNLDPMLLIEGGVRLDAEVDRIIAAFEGRPHIFNLGHGVHPTTPIRHVEQVMARIRGRSA